MNQHKMTPVLVLSALTLVSCGGGLGDASTASTGSNPPPTYYTVAGSVAGLQGTGLILQDNGGDDLAISGNGVFTFASRIANGIPYSVTVLSQPSNPVQNCVITNSNGTAKADVTNIQVGCVGLWTWIAGSNLGDQGGNSGTVGVPNASSIPGARQDAIGCSDRAGNFWLYGGVGYNFYGVYGGLSDLWHFSAGEWTPITGLQQVDQLGIYGTLGVPNPSNTPGYRLSGVCWTDSTGEFWLFGGLGNGSSLVSGWLNDLWRYSGGEWTWMGGSSGVDQTAVYGSIGVPSPSNFPGARASAASWVDSAGNFWLFGGTGFDSNRADDYGWLNDLWEYTAGQWVWMGGSIGHSQRGVYGTQGAVSPANFPGARYGAVALTDIAGNFWLFGGFGYATGSPTGFLNDLWKYSGGQWTWVSGSDVVNQQAVYGAQGFAALGNVPGARENATGWIDNAGNLWLFGGTDLGGNFNDLWRYSSGQWTWVAGAQGSLQDNEPGVYGIEGVPAATNMPGARTTSVSWSDPTGNLWLFGGDGYDSTGTDLALNDLWEYVP